VPVVPLLVSARWPRGQISPPEGVVVDEHQPAPVPHGLRAVAPERLPYPFGSSGTEPKRLRFVDVRRYVLEWGGIVIGA
jgi:hypothetical protein